MSKREMIEQANKLLKERTNSANPFAMTLESVRYEFSAIDPNPRPDGCYELWASDGRGLFQFPCPPHWFEMLLAILLGLDMHDPLPQTVHAEQLSLF